jgi:hypothetical protein
MLLSVKRHTYPTTTLTFVLTMLGGLYISYVRLTVNASPSSNTCTMTQVTPRISPGGVRNPKLFFEGVTDV